MTTIATLGAYDRFNYGDLLFPIVVRNWFAGCTPAPEVAVHALVDSDLSRWGGLPTRALRRMLRAGALPPDSVVMFVGGGTLGSSWSAMHANLVGRRQNLLLYYFTRLFGADGGDALSRFYMGGRAAFPWIATPADFPVPVKVMYNAVGGSELVNLPEATRARVLQVLSQASYLSVRDVETKRILAPIDRDGFVHLAPDSAVIMSEQFPRGWLDARVGDTTRALTTGGGRYVCLQSNRQYAELFLPQIVAQIERIWHEHGLRCVLLPIGRYVGLEDQVCEGWIAERVKTPVAVAGDDISLWEIMYTIANAAAFVGTSLHGNITAQSFAVPHLGLSEAVCKVDYYLQSWELPEQAACAPIDALSARVGTVLAIPQARLDDKRRELIGLATENFRRMARAIGLTPPR